MLVVYKKETGECVARFSSDQQFETIYQGNPYALENLSWIQVDHDPTVKKRITDYKVVGNQLVEISKEEKKQRLGQHKPEYIKEMEELKKENAQLLYESMMKDGRIDELEAVQADIMYQVMIGGM